MKLLALLLLFVGAASAGHAQSPGESQGEYVARAGDCVACHSVAGGKAFAGGLKMGTPLGAIYATNITPDQQTGIGKYTLKEFDDAVRHGVARDGHHLYPAMPYPSYARLTDADVAALYAYFMNEVPPVQQPNRPSDIPAILGIRWPLAVWNLMFANPGPYKADPAHDAAWNRGAYLVQGLEHCGACHTPRGLAFEEKALTEHDPAFLAGAPLDGWSAPNLRGDLRTGLGAWSPAELAAFLKSGHNRDGAAFGSMVDVVNNSLPYLSDADVQAMVAYLKSLPPSSPQLAFAYNDATKQAVATGRGLPPGGALYAANCSSCHGVDGNGFGPYMPRLAGNPIVLDPDPSSLINITLNASTPLVVKGVPDAYRMPEYRVQFTDQQIADVLSFVRDGWGNHAPPVTRADVTSLRHSTDPASDRVTILRMR